MTFDLIQTVLFKAGKKLGSTQLRKYLKKLKIEPLGCRQRPQQYPDDAAEKILKHLGFSLFHEKNGIDFAVSASQKPVSAQHTTLPTARNGNGSLFTAARSLPATKTKSRQPRHNRAAGILSIKQLKKARKL